MRKINKLDDIRITNKWMPVIERHLKYKNNNISTLICLYCEWYTSGSEEHNDLTDKLIEIKDKIDSYERIEILGKYFNPASGHIEYKLESGKFIPIDSEISYELSDNDLIKMFGIEFIRDLDPQKFRDRQLDKIL